jgi:LPS sulfotransferase NodH
MGIGNPGEFLNPSLIDEPELGGPASFMKPSPTAYVERLKRAHTVNGVFGIKAHYIDLVRYSDISENMSQLFPDAKFISITRRNVLRQALSGARAAQTMAWTSGLAEQKRPHFRFWAVLKHVIHTLREVEAWERFYKAHGIKPLRIVYEDLDEEYQSTMLTVLGFLGVDGTIPDRPIRKQADATTEEWVERFMGAFRDKGVVSRAVRLITRQW